MLNVVYLVLVMYADNGSWGSSMTSISIPQANMAQCQANLKNYGKAGKTANAYCIAGVMPK
ncbi:MAG: hypothetical protein [Caudoviricetes sp.]|nr:MAG: hypothetical protein [Caudoviricetes sp.]